MENFEKPFNQPAEADNNENKVDVIASGDPEGKEMQEHIEFAKEHQGDDAWREQK